MHVSPKRVAELNPRSHESVTPRLVETRYVLCTKEALKAAAFLGRLKAALNSQMTEVSAHHTAQSKN